MNTNNTTVSYCTTVSVGDGPRVKTADVYVCMRAYVGRALLGFVRAPRWWRACGALTYDGFAHARTTFNVRWWNSKTSASTAPPVSSLTGASRCRRSAARRRRWSARVSVSARRLRRRRRRCRLLRVASLAATRGCGSRRNRPVLLFFYHPVRRACLSFSLFSPPYFWVPPNVFTNRVIIVHVSCTRVSLVANVAPSEIRDKYPIARVWMCRVSVRVGF